MPLPRMDRNGLKMTAPLGSWAATYSEHSCLSPTPYVILAYWPISELTAHIFEVRSMRHGGLDLLCLGFPRVDPKRTLRQRAPNEPFR